MLNIPLFKRLWESPTFTTWGSFASRTLSLILVLPLILTKFTTEEIALWYLFSSFIGMQLLADFGFGTTFTRVIAYSMGGATELQGFRENAKLSAGKPNYPILEQICSTMGAIYTRLTFGLIFLLGILGTWALIKPISNIPDPQIGWSAWAVILLTTAVTFKGNSYSCYLQGTNHIALLRRWEIFTSSAAIITSTLVLLWGGGILGLVIANQGWAMLNILRNRWLCTQVEDGIFTKFKEKGVITQSIFDAVWPSAWRSGLGIFMSYGLIQISGILYAQVGAAANVASYLLALRLMQVIKDFSTAPFYSKLPLLARLRAEGNLIQQIQMAQRGMQLAHWTFTLGFVAGGLLIPQILVLIGSRATFVDPALWSMMGLAFFAERYGAMHLQLYSITNHILWHIANGITGIIYIAGALILFPYVGIYAFPISMLVSYLSFYTWYSAYYSYKTFKFTFWDYEKKVMLPPLAVLILCIGFILQHNAT